jgi:GT2 family glycosyltransferase
LISLQDSGNLAKLEVVLRNKIQPKSRQHQPKGPRSLQLIMPLPLTPYSVMVEPTPAKVSAQQQSEIAWQTLDLLWLPELAGRFVEIIYRQSQWDQPVRPIFRFETSRGPVDVIAPAAVVGSAIWIGRIPPETSRVRVSSSGGNGFARFTIERVRRRSWIGLFVRGLFKSPFRAIAALGTLLIGYRPESDLNLAWAINFTHLGYYAAWRRARERKIDLVTIDVPSCAWDQYSVQILIDASDGASCLAQTIASLRSQLFQNWSALVISREPLPLPADSRIRLESDIGRPAAASFYGALAVGDTLPETALAYLVERASHHPNAAVFYGDEEIESAKSCVVPVLKPGWSPLLYQQRHYLGRAVFIRPPGNAWGRTDWKAFAKNAALPPAFMGGLPGQSVIPLRRIMLRTTQAVNASAQALYVLRHRNATATIVIPTKNNVDRLKRVMQSIRAHESTIKTEIVIVDNGSQDASALRYLRASKSSGQAIVIECPGIFNFSHMCNCGAMVSSSDLLIFLNNDVEILSASWLERLAALALRPEVGAVGAKLTYPDGRLQHRGIVLGMGGTTGHLDCFAPADSEGWAQRGLYVHEIAAVTGACLAVERRKFEAVGGFDAAALPVEFSDIDFCLQLRERGWVSLVDPAVHLIHEESATRGKATFRRLSHYRAERIAFTTRWQHFLRDDPYFHPALSLFRLSIALG